MNTTEKGNKLEDSLSDYLFDQVSRNELVYDTYPADRCTIIKKANYYCRDRQADINFDVVVEIRRKGGTDPHLFLVFECKNHHRPIEDSSVRNFSDQISSVFGNAAKGIIVTSSRLQSGAENVAKNRRIGIVKFDKTGIEILADRTVGGWMENGFVKSQIFDGSRRSKSLKFSACIDGKYFSSFNHMLHSIDPDYASKITFNGARPVEYLSEIEIENITQKLLSITGYDSGKVDVEKICKSLNIDFQYLNETIQDSDGNTILGSANFSKRTIDINRNGNANQERFTFAHEIGHFALQHGEYLHADSIIENDLYEDANLEDVFNFERLEYQANLFASLLLLPRQEFFSQVGIQRSKYGTHGRTFGYIFVDDQPCNYEPYNQMITELSAMFGASRKAVEIRIKRANLLTDNRTRR